MLPGGTTGSKVVNRLDIQRVTLDEKYLGLPMLEGHMSKDRFKSTKERLAKRFNSWAEKYMSMGGKEVLIKSVAQAIPTYVMGGFQAVGIHYVRRLNK